MVRLKVILLLFYCYLSMTFTSVCINWLNRLGHLKRDGRSRPVLHLHRDFSYQEEINWIKMETAATKLLQYISQHKHYTVYSKNRYNSLCSNLTRQMICYTKPSGKPYIETVWKRAGALKKKHPAGDWMNQLLHLTWASANQINSPNQSWLEEQRKHFFH